MRMLVSETCKLVDFCHLNREGRVPIIAILLDVGKDIYKSTVKLKEIDLPQKMKMSPVFCDH